MCHSINLVGDTHETEGITHDSIKVEIKLCNPMLTVSPNSEKKEYWNPDYREQHCDLRCPKTMRP